MESNMTGEVLVIIGVFFCMVSLLIFVYPNAVLDVVRGLRINTGLRVFIGIVRIALGIFVVQIAEATQFPLTLRWIGALLVISGVLVLMLGNAKTQAMVDWIVSKSGKYVRLGGLGGFLFGCFLIYSVL